MDLAVALPLNVGSGRILIQDLARRPAEKVVRGLIAVEIEMEVWLVDRADRKILRCEGNGYRAVGQTGVARWVTDGQGRRHARRQDWVCRPRGHACRRSLRSRLIASSRDMTECDGAWSIDGKHVAARVSEKHRVDVATRDEEQAYVGPHRQIAKRPGKLALTIRSTASRVVFRDNLIACVHRHDASARDGPADRGAGLGRGGRPSSS